MTLDERVEAGAVLGFTPRQARFLVTVALHSGFCLRRQYEAFAGIQYGKNVREFLDGLVARGWAERFKLRADRGHVYHLHARSLYRAIGQEDNRNRRSSSSAQIARKLMLLDYALNRPSVAWYATEQEKVDLFVNRFGISLAALPRRMFKGTESRTTRHFVHKLPIFVAGNPAVAHFVYLSTDRTGDGLQSFLAEHQRLLNSLSQWAMAVTGLGPFAGARGAFDRFVRESTTGRAVSTEELRWFFERRRIVEANDLARVSIADLQRWRGLRERLQTQRYEAAYASWLSSGEIADVHLGERSQPSIGRLLIEPLPFSYEQFGSLPGVA